MNRPIDHTIMVHTHRLAAVALKEREQVADHEARVDGWRLRLRAGGAAALLAGPPTLKAVTEATKFDEARRAWGLVDDPLHVWFRRGDAWSATIVGSYRRMPYSYSLSGLHLHLDADRGELSFGEHDDVGPSRHDLGTIIEHIKSESGFGTRIRTRERAEQFLLGRWPRRLLGLGPQQGLRVYEVVEGLVMTGIWPESKT